MICAAIGLGLVITVGAFFLIVAWLNRNAPREDRDFLRASDWRDEAEREVDALRNPDHAAIRKYMRGDR